MALENSHGDAKNLAGSGAISVGQKRAPSIAPKSSGGDRLCVAAIRRPIVTIGGIVAAWRKLPSPEGALLMLGQAVVPSCINQSSAYRRMAARAVAIGIRPAGESLGCRGQSTRSTRIRSVWRAE